MSRKRTAPVWAFDDNKFSEFGQIYADMLKSKAFQKLSIAAQKMYIVVTVNARTQKGCECLYNALESRYKSLEIPYTKQDLIYEVYQEQKKFIFPKVQYEKYGYTKAYVSKYLKELIDNGFVKVYQNGKNQWRVNIYEFSSDWKKKK